MLAPQPLNPLLRPCFPSSRKCALIRGADGFTPPGAAQAYGGSSPGRDWQRKHSPSTAASCPTCCCSRACSAGPCMNSSAPPRLEPSRFTNCRADSRGPLSAHGSPRGLGSLFEAVQASCSMGGPPWLFLELQSLTTGKRVPGEPLCPQH